MAVIIDRSIVIAIAFNVTLRELSQSEDADHRIGWPHGPRFGGSSDFCADARIALSHAAGQRQEISSKPFVIHVDIRATPGDSRAAATGPGASI